MGRPDCRYKIGDGNFYPIPELFGTQLASAAVPASTITGGQLDNIHVNFSKLLYAGKKVTFPQFVLLFLYLSPGRNFATDTVGYVLEADLNTTITGQLTIDTLGDGSSGLSDMDGNNIPMRTYQEELDAGNQVINGQQQPIGGGGGFFINFGQLDPTNNDIPTDESYDGNLLLTTEFSGASAGVTPNGANEYSLDGNYPDPVVTTTYISYNLANSGPVSLVVYNQLGEKVGTIVNSVQGAGVHTAAFDAGTLPDGMYYYKLQSGEFTATNTMVIAR